MAERKTRCTRLSPMPPRTSYLALLAVCVCPVCGRFFVKTVGPKAGNCWRRKPCPRGAQASLKVPIPMIGTLWAKVRALNSGACRRMYSFFVLA